MSKRSLALAVVAACFVPRVALAQSTPPAPVTSLTATTISQTQIDLSWNANLTPTPTLPGTFTIFFAGTASNVAADITITGNGELSGVDAATGASNNAVTFDSGIDFAPGASTVALTKTGNGATKGTGDLDGVTGAAQGSVKASFAPLFPRLAALKPGTTYTGGLSMTGNSSITTGGPLLVEGQLSLTGNGDIGTLAAPMIVIVRPTSVSQLNGLIQMTGNGNIYGAVFVDLSLLSGNPLKLTGALLSITGNGFLSGIFAVNGPSCPLTIGSHMITGFTGNGGFLGGAVLQINGSLVNAQGSNTPPGSLPLVSITGNGNVQYDSKTIASTYTVLVAASAPSSYLVERSTQSGGPYTQVGSPTTTSFADTNLSPGTTYFYVVQAQNAAGASPDSSQVSAITIPSTPIGVSAATASQTEIDVTWTPSAGATSYVVSRGAGAGGPYSPVGTSSGTTFNDTGLAAGTTYYYVVQASDSGGTSPDSADASATTIPSTPTAVVASAASQAQINVSWAASQGATSYVVSRGSQSGGPYTPVASPVSSSFQDTGLAAGTTYYYVVQATDSGGTSPASAQASATTIPNAPTNLVATAVSPNQINLLWTASTGATGYVVSRGSRSGGPYAPVGTPSGTTFQDTGLAVDTTYYYVVQATDSGGASPDSSEASARTHPNYPTLAVTPANGTATSETLPAIILTYAADPSTTISLSSVQLSLDGTALTAIAQIGSASAYLPTAPLAEGSHTIVASASDALGDTTTLKSTFTIELTANHFVLSISPSAPQSVLVDSLNTLTIAAVTSSGFPAKGFTGEVQITETAGQTTLSQTLAVFTIANLGTFTLPNQVLVTQVGLTTVTAVAIASPSIQGSLGLVGVSPSFSRS
jgi:fibronectin type 3 domain-containing protein